MYVEKNSSLYLLQPADTITFIQKIDKPTDTLPQHFKLKIMPPKRTNVFAGPGENGIYFDHVLDPGEKYLIKLGAEKK